MKKNVLLIHILRGYPLGTESGDKVRTLNMAASLHKMGYNVILLNFFTQGLSGYKKEKSSLPPYLKSIIIYTMPNRLHLQKLAAWYRAVITLLICKLYSVDVIQAELASASSCAKLVPGIPLITDFHSDIAPEAEMDQYAAYLVRHAKEENRYALLRSRKTITVSENLRKNLAVYEKSQVDNYILPCNFDSKPFLELAPGQRERLRKELALEDRIVLCYSGGLHTWQCIAETLDLIIRLRKRNPAYFLCMFTNDDIMPYAEQLQELEGHYIVKGLKREEVPAYLSMIDVGFVLRDNSLVNINSSPTKTSEYFAAGAMVVATRYAGDAPDLIRGCGYGVVLNGLFVSEEELEALDNGILSYAKDYLRCSSRVKDFVFANRVWSSNEEKLKALYESLDT